MEDVKFPKSRIDVSFFVEEDILIVPFTQSRD